MCYQVWWPDSMAGMRHSAFRGWVHNLWVENCEERMLYNGGERLAEREYWHRFRWWLRREWRHREQRQQQDHDRAREALKKLAHAIRPGQ